MKNKICLIILTMLLITGCSGIYRIQDEDFNGIVNDILLRDNKLYNVAFEGYKYYIPRGLAFVEKDQFNAILKDKDKNKYYLYIDVISYHHRSVIKEISSQNKYYYKKIKNNKKDGYLAITKIKGKYYIEYVYNYAKIEAYVEKDDITQVVTNASYILSSMNYNRKILETIVGENILDYKEEEYSLFKHKDGFDNFLNYVKEYGTYYDKNKELPDQDKVKIEGEK